MSAEIMCLLVLALLLAGFVVVAAWHYYDDHREPSFPREVNEEKTEEE